MKTKNKFLLAVLALVTVLSFSSCIIIDVETEGTLHIESKYSIDDYFIGSVEVKGSSPWVEMWNSDDYHSSYDNININLEEGYYDVRIKVFEVIRGTGKYYETYYYKNAYIEAGHATNLVFDKWGFRKR